MSVRRSPFWLSAVLVWACVLAVSAMGSPAFAQGGTTPPDPVTLTLDQPVSATVNSQTPTLVYRFSSTSTDVVTMTVLSQTADSGLLVTIYNDGTNMTVASIDAGAIGMALQLPANGLVYRVEVQAAGSGDTAFSICAGTCTDSLLSMQQSASVTADVVVGEPAQATAEVDVTVVTAEPTEAAATEVPAAAATEVAAASEPNCMAAASVNKTANLRSAPGSTNQQVGVLVAGQSAPVLGKWTDGNWYLISYKGALVWVSGSVSTLSGDCTSLPQADTSGNVLAVSPEAVATMDVSGTVQHFNDPDLTPTAVNITLGKDGVAHVSITMINNGLIALTPDQTFAITFCAGANRCVELDNLSAHLPPLSTAQFKDDIPNVGTSDTITVTLDAHNQVEEGDESNNQAVATLPG